MNIKKFVAHSTQQAIRMVKKEMGAEAVILRTRTLSADEGEKKVEVTAAIDYEPNPESHPPADHVKLEELLRQWQSMESQIREIKEAILSGSASMTMTPELYFDPSLRGRFMNYRSFGLHSATIRKLMNGKEDRNGGKEISASELLRVSLAGVLARIDTDAGVKAEKGKKKIFSFIGPTGVGKTTTLAKLAALNAIKQGKKTVLITLDTFRIAAVAQLQSYARIMGIPLEVAVNRQELQNAVQKHRQSDLILIDTAGRSPNQAEAIEELKDVLNIHEDIHSYLVLSATEQYGNLVHADGSFGNLPFKSYIFTKLDETKDVSPMINFLIDRQKPVSYLTGGQQVPEDIEVATKKKLASLILAGMRETAENSKDEVMKYGSSDRT